LVFERTSAQRSKLRASGDNPFPFYPSIRFTREENPPDEEERFLVKRLKKTRQRNHEFQTARRR
jgi:hypothetical protein